MRGYRAVLLLTAHLVVLALVVGLAYLFIRSSLTTIGNLEERRTFGKSAFGLIIWMELVMISFVAPALTSGAISIERERQTFDLLRVTLLPARSLVWGKYICRVDIYLSVVVHIHPAARTCISDRRSAGARDPARHIDAGSHRHRFLRAGNVVVQSDPAHFGVCHAGVCHHHFFGFRDTHHCGNHRDRYLGHCSGVTHLTRSLPKLRAC